MTKKLNKIEKLIAELCPEGVEFVSIGELCVINRGRVMSKDYLQENIGEFPVYSSQTVNQGKIGNINAFDYNGEYLTWTTDGANAGTVFYRNGKFSITNVCGLLKPKEENLNIKYLSYILGTVAKSYVSAGMGNPKLMSNVMGKIKIPIPPLKIQEAIVKVLDTFTELEAELEARKKQYEYYRDEMLSFEDDEVEWTTLNDACFEISAGGDRPKKYKKGQIEPSEEFPYPIFSNGTDEKALYGYSNDYKINKEAVTISARGTIGYHTIRKSKFTPIVRLIILIPNNKLITTKFLNYILDKTEIGHSGGSIPQLTTPNVKKIKIPIPPLQKQKEIVAILDKFDALVNDISIGLPAELKARRQQYEYYREKLLTFKSITN